MAIVGIEGMSDAQVAEEIRRGARFVIFQYCISIFIMTFKRTSSDVHFVRAGEGTFGKSWGASLVTLLLGWWGIPWGPIYSIQSLWVNANGGHDVTHDIVRAMNAPASQSAPRIG